VRERDFAGEPVGAAKQCGAAGAMMWGSIGASLINSLPIADERVEFGNSNCLCGIGRRQ